jgi:hypothetical protein
MPPTYQQNKKHIYKWVENNKDQHLKNVKIYYQKNKEKIIMNKLAKKRLGNDFHSFCIIYNNLYEL